MDSDQIHTALIGLNITISVRTNEWLGSVTYEKQEEDHDTYEEGEEGRQLVTGCGARLTVTYTCAGTITQPIADWMKSRHSARVCPGC